MEVILLENILKLGKIGDQVKVKNGYGRNFLLKTGKALRANKENIELVGKKKTELNKKNEDAKANFVKLSKTINNKSIKVSKEKKENGELFASIKPKEICSIIKKELQIDILPSQIDMREDIDKLGKFKINISFHAEVSSVILLEVI